MDDTQHCNNNSAESMCAVLKEIRNFIAENEAANMVMQEALIKSMERQKTMQKKLTDLEGRSRRNNISISSIPEGKEGNCV